MGRPLRIAIISGGSHGLGYHLVHAAASTFLGLDEFWLVGRSQPNYSQVNGVPIRFIPTDLTKPNAVANGVGFLLTERQLEVVLLINNSGHGLHGKFSERPLAGAHSQVQLNITGLLELTHAVLPYMPRGARIVNVGSIAGLVGSENMAVYAATKAFVAVFSTGLRRELRDRKISVTNVMPGPMHTSFFQQAEAAETKYRMWPHDKPEIVARHAMWAAKLRRRKAFGNPVWLAYFHLSRFLPHWFVDRFTAA